MNDHLVIECSECGHLHFDVDTNDFGECPLADDGCTCPMSERTTPHRYVPTGVPHWRTCRVCGRGANQQIHRLLHDDDDDEPDAYDVLERDLWNEPDRKTEP